MRLIVATRSSGPPASQPVSCLTRLSADLSVIWLRVPDYYLWGYLKGRVYRNKPRTIDALKANITEEIQAVTADVLARTFQNMARRIQSCLDANGGHFQHMLWCRHISHTTNVLLFKFRCKIFIGVRIIKEMPGSVASGTPCIILIHSNVSLYEISNNFRIQKESTQTVTSVRSDLHTYTKDSFLWFALTI